MKVVSISSFVELAFAKIDDGCGECVESIILTSITGAYGVERSRRVCPVEMTKEALFTEDQLLAPDTKSELAGFDIAEFDVSLAQVECVFKRRGVRLGISRDCLRVLSLQLDLKP